MHPTDNNIPRNIFQELIAEVIKPDEVDVESIKQHEGLHSEFWDEYKLKPEIRKILLENAMAFIKYAKVEDLKFNDITLTGSMANYTYNDDSDIDLHIILDFSQLSDDVDLVSDLFKTKKKLWMKNFLTKIKNHEVEITFQDINQEHRSTGIYSLMKDGWIRKPVKKVLDINTNLIKQKTTEFINKIDELKSSMGKDGFMDEYEDLKGKIKKYRKAGLSKEGEFSIENLVFKLLRNLGYLEVLFNLKAEHLSKELSLNQ